MGVTTSILGKRGTFDEQADKVLGQAVVIA